MTRPKVNPYPHAGACAECRQRRECNYCGKALDRNRCTNGRCGSCHRDICTSGGVASPGHGFGKQGGAHYGARPMEVVTIMPGDRMPGEGPR